MPSSRQPSLASACATTDHSSRMWVRTTTMSPRPSPRASSAPASRSAFAFHSPQLIVRSPSTMATASGLMRAQCSRVGCAGGGVGTGPAAPVGVSIFISSVAVGGSATTADAGRRPGTALGRPFVDARHALVVVPVRQRVLVRAAGGAVDLDRAVDHAVDHLGAQHLHHARLDTGVLAAVGLGRAGVQHQPVLLDLDPRVDDHRLHRLFSLSGPSKTTRCFACATIRS